MTILSIETSCDETSLAILSASTKNGKTTFRVRAHETFSQAHIHAPYGGVYPNVAKREHAQALVPLFTSVLKNAKLARPGNNNITKKEKTLKKLLTKEPVLLQHLIDFFIKNKKPPIDLIVVTVGPGLEPALWVGINFAKALKLIWDIPVYGAHHMEGHILSVFTKGNKHFTIPQIHFPVLSLLVSGGHTELVLIKEFGKYVIVGETRDDAAGEAFDKVARTLGLSYPGGPEISKLATIARTKNIQPNISLPRPMITSKDFDFSFSGLKTAVLYTVRDIPPKNMSETQALCREFEDAVVDVLVSKTVKAAKKYGAKTIIIGGGVSANKQLQKILTKHALTENMHTLWPSSDVTGDNALMIGIAGYMRYIKKKKSRPLVANGNLRY